MENNDDKIRNAVEIVRIGNGILLQRIEPLLDPTEKGKFIAVDVDSEAYEIDKSDHAAFVRLLSKYPSADVHLARIGEPATYRMRSQR